MGILPSGDPANWSLTDIAGPNGLIANITDTLVLLAGIVAVVMIMVGAVNYLTAFGNEEKATAGKKTLMWAIIGLVVIAAARLIIGIVWHFITPEPF